MRGKSPGGTVKDDRPRKQKRRSLVTRCLITVLSAVAIAGLNAAAGVGADRYSPRPSAGEVQNATTIERNDAASRTRDRQLHESQMKGHQEVMNVLDGTQNLLKEVVGGNEKIWGKVESLAEKGELTERKIAEIVEAEKLSAEERVMLWRAIEQVKDELNRRDQGNQRDRDAEAPKQDAETPKSEERKPAAPRGVERRTKKTIPPTAEVPVEAVARWALPDRTGKLHRCIVEYDGQKIWWRCESCQNAPQNSIYYANHAEAGWARICSYESRASSQKGALYVADGTEFKMYFVAD